MDSADRLHKKVIERFKKERLKAGISHLGLAEKVGVTRPAISYIESGKRKPSMLFCFKIAAALNLSLSDIIKEESKKL